MSISSYSGLQRLLKFHSEQIPDAVAIAAPGRTALTYPGLLAQVDYVVRTLHAMALARNDRVAIVLPNGPEMAVAFLSVACCATAVPLNPAYRANEFDFYLSDLNAKALIVQDTIGSPAIVAAQKRSIPVIELSAAAECSAGVFSLRGQGKSCESDYGFAESEDIALVLHTSGTTAAPKRVPLTHANLLASAANIAATLKLTDKDRCLNVMPLFHIHGLVGALLSSMITGSSVVCTSAFDPERFWTWLEEFAPTWYTAVPTMHQALLAKSEARHGMAVPSSLRLVRSSSAPLPSKVMAELEKLFQVPVIEAYGMTEAAHQIASNPLPPRERKAGSVGVTIGTQVAIMDEAGHLLPPGAVGEVVIRGSNVMAGYEAHPAAHQSTFMAGWLRTGDQGRLDKNGYLFITGRLKEIINRGGEKVSPYEVEAVLRQHPAIAEVAVFPLPHPTLGEDIAAAVTLKPKFSPTEYEIQLFAASRLTECKVPRRVVILDEIPKGPTGKIDRLHLARQLDLEKIDGPATDPKPDFVAPRTEIEATLARIWSQLLGIAQVGVHDDFFQLGGESIVTAQIINRVRTALQVELSPVRFFETPTIAGQAVLIEQIALKEAGRSFPATTTDLVMEKPSGEAFPLSAMQRRLWFFQQLNPQSVVAVRPVALMLTGELNRDILEQSLSEITRRHEILRTIYPEQNGEPVQIVLPFQPIHVDSRDLRSLPETKWESEMKQIALEEARSLAELSKKPPLKPLLFERGERQYFLLILTHHIAFDGWSEAVLIRELATLYEAFLQGRTSPLPPLPLQYRDFALQQQRRFSETGGEKEIDYWKRRLEGIAPTLSLPTISTRSHVPLVERSQRSFVLDPDLSERLKILSRQESVTPFMTLLGAFQILLSRYSQQDDIAVGTLIAGRSQSEIEGLIGSFANLLVLRTDLSSPCTFRELLQKVRKTALEAYEHQELPFDRLIEALEPNRRLNQTPLFQVLFELRSMPRVQTITAGGLHIERRSMEFNLGTWELMLQLSQSGDSFHGTLEFASELFRPDTIESMANHYETLLRSIVTDPNRQLFNLVMLTQAETEQCLLVGKGTRKDCPKDKCIHELFEEQVERNPDAIALVFETQQLTYRELNSKANQLAHYLKKQGVGSEAMVAICLTRSVEMVVGILGILKAGGAYVPLDPNYPKERLAFMLEDAQPSVLLTQGNLVGQMCGPSVQDSKSKIQNRRVICLDRDWEDITKESQDNLPRLTTPDNLVYVIYTSGSTGTPKGTLISHHNVVRLFHATHSWFHFNANDVWTLFHSYAFDFSVWELWGALLHGGRLVIVSFEVNRSPEEFYDLLRREQVTVLNQTPGAFRLLMEAEQSIPDRNSLALRLIIFGGESLDVQNLRPWFERHGDQEPQLINMYGITETTVHVTYRAIKESDIQSHGSSLIGVPLPDLELYVLDHNRQLVPVSVPGELYVGGAGLARGYLNRAELTAERFVIHPFDNGEGRRLYKSGDLVRHLSNGELEYLGRVDDQVKIRGFRIELGEIEAVLSRHPEVRQSVVMAREDVSGDKRLVAYVVSDPKETPTSSELLNFLRERLPDYMLPSSFVFLETLPLTRNGKVDRKALPAPDQIRPELTEKFTSPRTPAEEHVAAIWRELLHKDQVGIHDSFFELGGHSLLLMQLASRIADAFQVRIPLRVLFDRSTIEEMVSAILERRVESADRVKLDQLLARVAQLSGEEVMQLLKAK